MKFCCRSSNVEENDSEKSFFAQSLRNTEFYSDNDYDDDNENDLSENWKLLKPQAPSASYSSVFEKYRRSSETIFNVTNLRNPFDEDQHQTDDETLANDTEFVVNAINDSHESLRKLVSK